MSFCVLFKKSENYCSLAKALSTSPLIATALPKRRVDVGMVRVDPEAAVKTKPPAVVNAAVEMGSGRIIGEGAAVEKEMRQAAMARTKKPITFMIKLLTVL